MIYDWIVVGGGIRGTAFLVKNNKVSPDKLRIIDPHEMPLFKWAKNTKKIGMTFLRSPLVHQLDVDPFSLKALQCITIGKKVSSMGCIRGLRLKFLMRIVNHFSKNSVCGKAGTGDMLMVSIGKSLIGV